jgi:hypothetical protein
LDHLRTPGLFFGPEPSVIQLVTTFHFGQGREFCCTPEVPA